MSEVKVTNANWGRIPRTFIRCLEDRALAPAVQERMIADADRFTPDNKFETVTIKTSHSSFGSSPDEVVRLLVGVG
jgi:hypothetical protein